MTTKAECLKLAKKLYGTKSLVEIRERKNWTAADRERVRERQNEIKTEVERHKAEQATLNGCDEALRAAARFVCDVNGDHPSIDQLREAIARAERAHELSATIRDLEAERRKNCGLSMTYRIDVVTYHNGPFPHSSVEIMGDSYAEVADKIRGRLGRYAKATS